MLSYKTSEFALSVPVNLIHIASLLITFLLILTFGDLISSTLINQLFNHQARKQYQTFKLNFVIDLIKKTFCKDIFILSEDNLGRIFWLFICILSLICFLLLTLKIYTVNKIIDF